MLRLKFNFNSIIELVNTFKTKQKCIAYLEKQRWNGNVISPYDANSKVYKCKNNLHKCKNTRNFLMLEQALCLKTAIFHFKNGL